MKYTTMLSAVILILIIAGTALAEEPTIVWSTDAYSSGVRDLSYAANGQSIATISSLSNSPVKVWSAVDGNLLQTINFNHTGALSVDLSPDGEHVAAGYIITGYPPGMLTNLWNLSPETLLNDFGGAYVAFSPDGMYLAAAGGGVYSYMNIYEVSSGNTVFSEYHGSYITAVAYSPTGDMVASGGTNNKVRLWDAVTGTMLYELTGHTDNISSLDFSPDGMAIASSEGGFDIGGQSVIKLWSVEDGTLLQTLDGFGDWVHDVRFSPDGQYLISSGRESTTPLVQKIKIWRVSDGQLVQEYDASAYAVEYSPDGQYFAYSSPYGGLYLAQNPFYSGSDLDIQLTYISGSPVPATGGNLTFSLYVENTGQSSLTFDGWLDIEYMGGSPTTVVQRSFSNFQPGWTINRPNMVYPIPAAYAAGDYMFYGRVGYIPNTVWNESGFPFTKEGTTLTNGFVPYPVDGVPNPFDRVNEDVTTVKAPASYSLEGAYPNPFNPTTTIRYAIPEAAKVTLTVYDIQGRQVAELFNGFRQAGSHNVTFDASHLASGVYLYRLSSSNFAAVGKMMLIK